MGATIILGDRNFASSVSYYFFKPCPLAIDDIFSIELDQIDNIIGFLKSWRDRKPFDPQSLFGDRNVLRRRQSNDTSFDASRYADSEVSEKLADTIRSIEKSFEAKSSISQAFKT